MAASLYWKHFGLGTAPFPLTPTDDAFYSGGSRKATIEATLHVLRDDSGIVKVVGEAGTGKTTLCRQLRRELRDRFTVVYTCDPSLSGDQTWFALADSLRLQVDRSNPVEVAARVRARVSELHDSGRPVLLLVDEAHALPGETREQFRLLGQHDAGGECMRIVLLGPDELDHDLALPSMDALRTRIAHSIRLKRLKLSDIDEYLHFRMRSAGWSGDPVFNANAVRSIARLTAGIPRRINVLADKALLSAAMDRRHTVGARDVAAAADEIKLARRSGGGLPWRLAGAAFAGGIVATAALGTAAWYLLRHDAQAARTAMPTPVPGVQPGGDPTAPRQVEPVSSSASTPLEGSGPALGVPMPDASGETTLSTSSSAPDASRPTSVSLPESSTAAPSRTASGPSSDRAPSSPGPATARTPSDAAPASRDPADLSAGALTLGELPAPRFVQDIRTAPTGSN